MNGFTQLDNNLGREIGLTCGSGAFHIYFVLYSHRNAKTGACYPSLKLLAEETGKSLSTIKRELHNLREAGFIDWTTGGYNEQTQTNYANSYTFPRAAKWLALFFCLI